MSRILCSRVLCNTTARLAHSVELGESRGAASPARPDVTAPPTVLAGLAYIWRARLAGALQGVSSQVPPNQNIAIGLTGEPVPRGIGSGAIINMNSHRLRLAAA